MRFAVLGCDLGTVILFARDTVLCRLDLVPTGVEATRAKMKKEMAGAAEDREAFTEVLDLLRRYFDGQPTDFPIPVDLSAMTDFTVKVLEAIRTVPYGTTTSYAAVARQVGRSKGPRAVGQALGRNP